MTLLRYLHGAAVASACLVPLASAAVYDPAAQFSPTVNPSGPWSYGWSQSLGSQFILDERHGPDMYGLDFWQGDVFTDTAQAGYFPLLVHNGTGKAVLAYNTVNLRPDEMLLHPGPGGEYSVMRFTADAPGSFTIRGRFMSVDLFPGVTDVHVLVNGKSVFNGVVDTYREGPKFRTTQKLLAGDVIDFSVGFGNESFFNDSTRLQATIVAVPEPSTVALWAMGLCLLNGMAKRRQR